MKKQFSFGIALLLMVGLVASSAFAMPFEGKFMDKFENDSMHEILESSDYDAYLELIEKDSREHRRILSEDEFNEKVEWFNDMEAKMLEREEVKEELDLAIESADYYAWKEIVDEMQYPPKTSEIITEENFDTLVEMHNARVSGDHETAIELADELGLEKPSQKRVKRSNGNFRGHGFKGNRDGFRFAEEKPVMME